MYIKFTSPHSYEQWNLIFGYFLQIKDSSTTILWDVQKGQPSLYIKIAGADSMVVQNLSHTWAWIRSHPLE